MTDDSEAFDANLPEDAAEALSLVAAALYDAALDPALWRPAMQLATRFTLGSASAIYEWSIEGTSRGFIHDDGRLAPAFKSLYFQHYARIDPVLVEQRAVAIDEPFSVGDMLDLQRYRRSRFFRAWSQPDGIVDVLAAPIERTASSAVLFGVVRRLADGPADEPMRQRMRVVSPHIRRAMVIGGLRAASAAHTTDLRATLDGLEAGVFLADAEGRLLHANTAGAQMLAEGAAMRSRNGRLAPPDAAAAGMLSEALAAARDGRTPSGDQGKAIAITGRDGTRFAAHLLPLGLSRQAGVESAAAAIFIHRAALSTPVAPELVARAYGLTPAERRVLSHIVEAGSVGQAAERLRLSETTVKTHLHRIFSKTGTGRQSELVKLLAGFAGPLAR